MLMYSLNPDDLYRNLRITEQKLQKGDANPLQVMRGLLKAFFSLFTQTKNRTVKIYRNDCFVTRVRAGLHFCCRALATQHTILFCRAENPKFPRM